MGKKLKQIQKREPHFPLPGSERDLESMGYAHGLNIRTRILFEHLEPGAPCPSPLACISTMPETQADVEEMARGISTLQLDGLGDEHPTTNNPGLFRELYEKRLVSGYRFGQYAFFHGYLELAYAQGDTDRRYELALRFAAKHLGDETWSDGIDPDMLQAVEELETIHKQYQALA